MKPIFPALCLAALGACAALDINTLDALNERSPLAFDPAVVDVALRLPDGLAIPAGGARLGFVITDQNGGQQVESYALAARPVQTEQGVVTHFGIAPQDYPALQRLLDRAEAEQAEGAMSLTISGCTLPGGIADNAQVSAAIRIEEGGAYMPLLRATSLRSFLGADGFAAIGPCSQGG